jgi:hypothetical protein
MSKQCSYIYKKRGPCTVHTKRDDGLCAIHCADYIKSIRASQSAIKARKKALEPPKPSIIEPYTSTKPPVKDPRAPRIRCKQVDNDYQCEVMTKNVDEGLCAIHCALYRRKDPRVQCQHLDNDKQCQVMTKNVNSQLCTMHSKLRLL